MSRRPDPELLDEWARFTLHDVCRICGVHAEFLMELVAEGVIAPRAAGRRSTRPPARPAQWHFDGLALVRVQRAVRLQEDLGVNLPGVALALELLDELEALRRQTR